MSALFVRPLSPLSTSLSLAGLALALLAGCALERSYDIKGRVMGFGDDGLTVIIQHEDVPGLMPAMTMSFKTRDPALIEGLSVQDAVRFRLVVNPRTSWIAALETLPDSAVAANPAGDPDPVFVESASSPLLDPGDPAPAFTLTNQRGDTVSLSDYEGRALVLTFIYTRCPIPDYCPLLSRQFQALQPQLRERYGENVHLLSISFDLEYDTPEILNAYARRYTDDTGTWTFATGAPEEIATLTAGFGVFYQGDGQTFEHNLATALISPEGTIQHIWRGNTWAQEDVLEAVQALMGS